ncbi:centromere protein K isoform X1 [Acinonyx jubatus]|uniref:Centromere protein K isoform X1 n=1 Tax=Acinonyx jubatus TaxID=32536 RepID=A0A6J1XWN1_ACIJB|nr:centromere protein K isoform X1 [Acinonyx jubatus]XP_026896863.1 centromere protein K isoform X1 [Acinonyx jubatus]XP_053079392.1 centromere protein K isoform X1 [Acinonyx jubatus]
MSVNQQDLDPDSSTDMEDVTNAEEELIKECDEMWKDMEECQKKLSLVGTETLTDSNAQLSLLIMQVKCLTAELSQWQKENPEIVPLNEEVLVTLGEEEFQKLRHDLELVLSTLQSKNEKLKEDLEREQQWLEEQQQILESLNVVHSELKNQVVTISESRILDELNTKMHDIKEYKEKLLITLGEFLEDHFPLPDRNVKKKKKKTNIQESTVQLITLHEMLEILLNRLFDVPHDPYVKISDSFWPPYIELLLRNGIALRHPEDPTQIRLEAFHQ